MPLYIFQHPKTQEIAEVYQSMSDEHIYIDSKGIKWDRVFTKPTASIDTTIDAFSSSDFVNKTRGKRDTVGDLWDRSAELSAKREKMLGKDSVKESAQLDYVKRTGKEHPNVRQERIKKVHQATIKALQD